MLTEGHVNYMLAQTLQRQRHATHSSTCMLDNSLVKIWCSRTLCADPFLSRFQVHMLVAVKHFQACSLRHQMPCCKLL